MGELLQVFDEKKNALGLADRGDVHSKGLFHEAVHVLLFKRNPGIKKTNPVASPNPLKICSSKDRQEFVRSVA